MFYLSYLKIFNNFYASFYKKAAIDVIIDWLPLDKLFKMFLFWNTL